MLLVIALIGCNSTDMEDSAALLPLVDPKPNSLNILMIISDDLGVADVGAYGNSVVQTPNIDKLAGEGLKFERAFVPASMCSPSRAAIYTGLYPHRNGMFRNHFEARSSVQSIPHYLSKLGYRTSLVGKSHVKPYSVFPFERLEREPTVVARYLDDLKGAPFAMVIAQHHPHIPWLPNADYDPESISLPSKLVDTPETREAMARYYSSISASDTELGRYLELLDERGLRDNTVVIYLSDHGPQLPFAKFSNYEAGLKVPMIVRWPSVVEGGSHSNALVSSTDILPTLIELAGGATEVNFDGKSLVPLLKGELETHHENVYGVHSTLGLNIPDLKPYGIRSMRTERYRYIRNLHPNNLPRSLMTEPRPLMGSLKYLLQFGVWIPPGLPEYWESWLELSQQDQSAAAAIDSYLHRPAEELYDLQMDPQEQDNLAAKAEYQVLMSEMRIQLDHWMLSQGDQGIKR